MSAEPDHDDGVEDEGPDLGLPNDAFTSPYGDDWASRRFGDDWAERRFGTHDDRDRDRDLVGYSWTPFEDGDFRRRDDRFARSDDGDSRFGNRAEDRPADDDRYPDRYSTYDFDRFADNLRDRYAPADPYATRDPYTLPDRPDPYGADRFEDRYRPPVYDPPDLTGTDDIGARLNDLPPSFWEEPDADRESLYAPRDERPPYQESPYAALPSPYADATASDSPYAGASPAELAYPDRSYPEPSYPEPSYPEPSYLQAPRDDPPALGAPNGIAAPDVDPRYDGRDDPSPYASPPPLPPPPLRLGGGQAASPPQSSLAGKLLGAFAKKLSGD